MTQALPKQWTEALSLSRRGAPEFYQAGSDIEPGPHAEIIRFALRELGLAAVFCIEGVPTIGFLNEPAVSNDEIDRVHRILWNQGLMSLLLVVSDDTLRAYSLVQRPFQREQGGSARDPRLIETLSLLSQAVRLREIIESTESGRYWYEHDAFFDPAQRVDNVLLENLLSAFREMKDELGGEGTQALLMQTMFIAYLEDRKLITPKVFEDASGGKLDSFAKMLEANTTDALEKLYVWLKGAFNGNVFNAPCAFELGQGKPPKLKVKHLRVLARFRHGREDMSSGQLRFFGYDFEHMPIALISAVYDRFLKEEAEKKNAEGAFYTPMFLADVVVNQVWDELSDEQRAKGVFCDPACGSGIFLVRLFQRLVAHHCRSKGKRHATWPDLIAIAKRLHGGDINAAAVRVAAFSLYIALLEQSNPPDLPALIEKGRLLPSLYGDTLRPEQDFFAHADGTFYDAVIGNPPWKGRSGQVTTAQAWTNEQGLPSPAKDIAWAFVWKSLKVLKPGGLVGILLPAMGVLHNTDSADARRALLKKARVRRIINLSDLCFQLFDGAQRPTAFVLYHPAETEGAPYQFEYWVPKADLNLRLKRLLTLSRADRTKLRSDHADKDPSVFKRRLWTRAPDEKLLEYLRSIPALNTFIRQFKELRGEKMDRAKDWVIGQGFKPAQESRKSDKSYQTVHAPAVTKYPYLAATTFETLVLPATKRKRWPDPVVHRAGFVEGFKGPHIIIPQGVERSIGRVRAAYTEENLSFEHSLQAIAFPEAERASAKLLTAILNSRLAAWFYFHETANLGTDRAKVQQADLLKLPFALGKKMPDTEKALAAAKSIARIMDREIERTNDVLRSQDNVLEKLDTLVYAYYGLDEHDIALVEDSFDYIIPAMQPRRSAGLQAIWAASREDHRSAYARTLCEALSPWLRSPVSARLAARSSDVAVLKLTINDGDTAYGEDSFAEAEPFLQQISSSLPAPLPGNVQLIPDLRFVIGKDMYLVKPIQLRHWLRSTALADAEQIAAELTSIIARERTRSIHDARG